MPFPDYVEKIIGYRQWNLSYFPDNLISQRFELSSPFIKTVWDLSEQKELSFLKASCDLNYMKFFNPQTKPVCTHEAPNKDCTCGYHVYHQPDFIPQFSSLSQGNIFDTKITVVGICQIAGKTQIHQRGSRSEYIKIKALLPPASKSFFHLAKDDNPNKIQVDFERWLQVHQIEQLEAPKFNVKGHLNFSSQWYQQYGKQISF